MNEDMLQWDYDKRKAGSSENAPFSPLWYKYSKFFVRTIHLNSGCVCCLASLGHIHTASVDEKPIACFLFLSSAHTLLVYTAATEKQEALGQQERWKQSNSLPNWQTSLLWLCSLHNTSVCVCSCRLSTDTISLTLGSSTAVWMWSTSIYPYLLMYVLMNSSPVPVLYSLQDKWSLKETLVWIH